MTGCHAVADGGDDFTPFPLEPGARLTLEQIAAIHALERAIVDGRGMHVPVDAAEAVVHEFSCQAQGSCVCATTRPIHD